MTEPSVGHELYDEGGDGDVPAFDVAFNGKPQTDVVPFFVGSYHLTSLNAQKRKTVQFTMKCKVTTKEETRTSSIKTD